MLNLRNLELFAMVNLTNMEAFVMANLRELEPFSGDEPHKHGSLRYGESWLPYSEDSYTMVKTRKDFQTQLPFFYFNQRKFIRGYYGPKHR